jgi:cyclophilin family peptidyl-prolyl cis-trans isomerase
MNAMDGQILRAMKLLVLDPEAVELFHGTIRKQLDMDYNRIDLDRVVATFICKDGDPQHGNVAVSIKLSP